MMGPKSCTVEVNVTAWLSKEADDTIGQAILFFVHIFFPLLSTLLSTLLPHSPTLNLSPNYSQWDRWMHENASSEPYREGDDRTHSEESWS